MDKFLKKYNPKFDTFYLEYCERPLGSLREVRHMYCYVAVLFNLYKLTTEDEPLLSVKELCDGFGAYKHSVYRMSAGHLCVNSLVIKEEHSALRVQAIKAANAYEKAQGRIYDYSKGFRANQRDNPKKSS